MKNHKKIKAVLFDKDGTLLDFNGCWLQPFQQAADYLESSTGNPDLAAELMFQGGYIAESQTWLCDSVLAAGSNRQILNLWSNILGEPIKGEKYQHIIQCFATAKENIVPAVQDIETCFAKLKSKKLALGVATMDDEKYTLDTLDTMKIRHYFDFVCGADSGYGCKPDPGMVYAFCRNVGVEANQVIMVGDSPRDMIMGHNAGVAYSLGVLTGAHDYENLKSYSDYVFNDITEIIKLLV